MPNKQVIETNKLKIGSSGATGLYVGNVESKYAVMTDSARTQTVVYDKVTYNFGVTDLSGTVPASGGTYNIAASTSTRTHGNGTVDQVSYSPTSVTVPANTGSSYSSSVTVTQASSNLTDAYNFTVAGDAVKSIALTISNPSTIPASGGSVSTCTTAATVTYNSGRVVTSFTPTSVNFNTVTASSKGTTTSDITTAGTLTCYIIYGGVTSNTASVYVEQAANAVVSYTGYSDLTGKSISASKVSAAGGTSTITWSGTPSAKMKPVYTSTATGSSVSYTPTISTAVTGNSAVASKGSTISNETTAIATVTGYYWANGLTASTTTSVKQNANYVTMVEATGSSSTSHFKYNNISAGATTSSIVGTGAAYYTFTSGSRVLDSSSSPSFGGTASYSRSNFSLASSQNGFTAVNANNGTLTATSLGTTISNARTSAVVTGRLVVTYTHASGYSGGTVTSAAFDSTATCTQNGNYVTGISVAGQGVSIANIPASGGSKTPSGSNGTVTYTFSSTSTSTTAPASTYGALTSSVSYAMTATGRFTLKSNSTGKVGATTKGTTIENVTNANTLTKTVNYTWTPTSSYNAAGTKTCSGTATCTPKQDGNYVTGMTLAGVSLSYAAIPAGGGSKTPTGSDGTVTYAFSSTSTSTSTPASTYGTQTKDVSYTMTASGRFTLKSASTGEVSATTKGTSVEGVTSSNTVTKTVTYTWTPSSSYSAAGTKTASGTATNKATQEANAVTGYTDYQTPTGKSISGTQVPASGGTSTITWSGTAAQNAKAVYTSTSTASTYTNVAPSVSTAITGNNTVTSKGTTVSNVTTAQTVTGYYWANGKTASTTWYVTQAANAVTSYTDYQTPTGKSISGSDVPAAGGTSTITWSGTAAQNAKAVYTSTSTASTYTTLNPTISTAITGNSAVDSKGTTISNATTAKTVTGYYWANNKTASTTCYVTQSGNYVSSLEFTTNPTLSYATTISAAGGSCAQSGGNGAIKYIFTSTSSATTAPASTYGSVTTTRGTYTMTNGNGFSLNTSNGTVTAESRSTTPGAARSSNQVSVTVKYTWTPTSSYPGGTKTVSKTATATATQEANAVTASGLTNITISTPTGNLGQIAASGGKKTFTTKTAVGGVAWSGYTANATATTQQDVTWAYNKADKASLENKFYFINNTTDGVGISAATWGTTTSNATTSQEVTIYAYVNNVNGQSKTGSTTFYATQAANTSTGSGLTTISITSPSGSIGTIPAGGGSTSPTLTATGGEAWTGYTSGSSGTSTPNKTWVFNKSANAALGTGFYFKNATTGEISAVSRTTTTGASRSSSNVTVYAYVNSVNGQSKTGSSTYYATQAANSLDSTTYGNVVITSPVSNSSLGPIAASGDSITPTLSAYQPITYTFTSNSTSAVTSTTLTWISNKSANASLGTGFYAISANGTVCAISAVTRGSTTGSVRTSNSITLTATGQGSKSTTTTYNAHQEANAMTVTYGDVRVGTAHLEDDENLGTFSASGGTLWAYSEYSQRNIISYTSTYTAASYTNYSDYTVTSPANNASIGNGMYFVSATKYSDEIGFKFSADTRGTTTGAFRTSNEFSITVTGLGNKKKTISGLTISQAANAIVQYYCGDVGLYTDNIPFSGSSAGRSIIVAGAHPFLPVKPIYTSNATGTTISSTTHSITNLSLVTTHQSGAYLSTSAKKVYMTGSTSANTATTSERNLLTIKGDVMYNNIRVVSSLTQTAYTSQFIAKQDGLPTTMPIYVVNYLNDYLTITGGTIAAYSGGQAKSFTANTAMEEMSHVITNLPTGVKLSGGTSYNQYGQFAICAATKTTIGLSANTKSNLPSSIYLVSSGGTVVTAGTLTRYTYVGSYYALYSGTSEASFDIPRYGYLIVQR